MGIEANKILNGQIFRIPLFDFGLYAELIENPVTILADDCWGGFVYHYLGLAFSSPLINVLWDKSEYAKFIQAPLFYLETELTMVREGDLRVGLFPIGKLGKNGKEVQIQFIHNVDFYEAKQQWDRRKKRINSDNLFVKMGFGMSNKDVKEYIGAFCNCKYNKILFYNGDEEIEGKLHTDRFLWYERKAPMVDNVHYENYMRNFFYETIDIFKLLTGSKNYSRE